MTPRLTRDLDVGYLSVASNLNVIAPPSTGSWLH